MKAHEIASQFDDRVGYSIVGYGEVGLPVFAVLAIGLVQQRKTFSAVEEFALRAIKSGLTSLREIASFLGLTEDIVSRSMVELIHRELVVTAKEGDQRTFALTKDGVQAAIETQIAKPEESILTFTYDGLIRAPKYYEMSDLIAPRHLAEMGLAEIPSMPNRGPEEDELNVLDVERVVASSQRGGESDGKLLKVKRVERRTRMFLPAVTLVYKDEMSAAYRVGFVINGRLSEEHELAFARHKGVERVGIFSSLVAGSPVPHLDDVLGKKFARSLPAAGQVHRLKRESARARAKVGVAQIKSGLASTEAERSEADAALKAAEANLSTVERKLEEHPVRPLPVYEHPPLLMRALQKAGSRLLIVSPWIRRAVIDREFLGHLTRLTESGVVIHIGYGLGEHDEGAREEDRKIESNLVELSKKHKNFVFRRLGDTHAKILILDREFFVITSFNWLSFRGDPNRTFREEWGTYVAVPEKVDEFYSEVIKRF